VFHEKTTPLIFYYIVAKLWTIFIKKNYTVCMLENVLFSTIKTFAHTLNILCKQLLNIKSKWNRKHSTIFN